VEYRHSIVSLERGFVMSRQQWWRLGAASGIAYVVLISVGYSIGPDTGIGVFLELLGFGFFPFFVGVLWAYLRRAEGAQEWLTVAVLGAALVSLAMKVGSVNTYLTVNAGDVTSAELESALLTTNEASFLLTFLPLATMMTAVAILAIQWDALPRWLGWAAAGTALALIIGVGGVAFDPVPGWGLVPFSVYLIWTVVVSVYLYRRAEEPLPETSQQPVVQATPAD
jgi:hypothetical protein